MEKAYCPFRNDNCCMIISLSLQGISYKKQLTSTKHEFRETCHSITFLINKKRLQTMLWHHYVRVNSHQRWKQTRFRVCFHLWCELTITMNVTEWQISWNSWKSYFGRKILDLKIFAPPLEGFAPPGNFPSYATVTACKRSLFASDIGFLNMGFYR